MFVLRFFFTISLKDLIKSYQKKTLEFLSYLNVKHLGQHVKHIFDCFYATLVGHVQHSYCNESASAADMALKYLLPIYLFTL